MILQCKQCGERHDHRSDHRCMVDTPSPMVDTTPKMVDTPVPVVDTRPSERGSRHGVHKDYEARKVQMREYMRRRRHE